MVKKQGLQNLRSLDYSGYCGHCQYKESCGGCRARAAYYHDGDYMAEEPGACIRVEKGGYLMDAIDENLLTNIQHHFPVSPRPYQVLAEKLGTSEKDVLHRVKRFKENGLIRRIGGVF